MLENDSWFCWAIFPGTSALKPKCKYQTANSKLPPPRWMQIFEIALWHSRKMEIYVWDLRRRHCEWYNRLQEVWDGYYEELELVLCCKCVFSFRIITQTVWYFGSWVNQTRRIKLSNYCSDQSSGRDFVVWFRMLCSWWELNYCWFGRSSWELLVKT